MVRGAIDVECSNCRKARSKKWRLDNLERAREVARNNRKNNPEPYRARAKAWYLANKSAALAASAARRKNKPKQVKSEKLKASFGITLEQYEAIAAEQNHACAICGTPQAEQRRKMAVDHDHLTGRVRRLLCVNCNLGLGNFKDNPSILTEALKYLHEHNPTSSQTSHR